VVSTKPGILLGFDDTPTREGDGQYPIALKGRVPVKVSTENGPINPGDQLMLSTIPGTAMKATGTGAVIGIALEAFNPTATTTYYSDTFINQYLDDVPVTEDKDAIEAELKDTPMQSVLLTEAEDSVLQGASPEEEQEVQVGQIVMFVDLSYRYLDDTTTEALATLMSTTTEEHQGENEDETLFARLTTLAKSFVDGVLSVFTLEAERVELANTLCFGATCIGDTDLQVLIDSIDGSAQMTMIDDETSGEVSIDMTTESPTVSTTSSSSATTTDMALNGDNSTASSTEISDNGETASTTTAGGSDGTTGQQTVDEIETDLVIEEAASSTENPVVELQTEEVQTENLDEMPSTAEATEAPETPVSADTDVEEETTPEPAPEPVAEEEVTNNEET
jgi:hypothetical protein